MAAQEFAELRHILDRAPALKGVAQQKTGWLVVWNMDYDFPLILGIIMPTDELIFSEGVGIPPTRCNGSTLHRHTSRNENSLRAILLCGFSLCLFCAEILPGAAAVFFSGLHPNGRLFACGHTGEFSSSLATMGGMKRESTVENSAPRGENTCRIFMELNMLTLA